MADNVQSRPQPLIDRLEEACRQVQLLGRELEEKTNVSPTQARVLRALLKADGVSQTSIVKSTNVDRSTLADVVRRLVKKGWLTRRRTKEDARSYSVRLTAEGRSLAQKVCKAV